MNTPDKVKILDGKITLYKTTKKDKKGKLYINQVWQAILKTPSSTGRIRVSTGLKNLEEAKVKAKNLLLQAEARVQTGLPLVSPKFNTLAEQYLDWLRKNSPTQNKITVQERQIRNSLIPYFKDKLLHTFSTKDFEKYHEQRTTQGVARTGKPVSGNTKNYMNSILNGIFKYAQREQYIKELPKMPTYSSHNQRASFTLEEMNLLQEKLDEWITAYDNSEAPHIQDYRKLFRLYVMIIYYAGIRPSSEMNSIHWSTIKYGKTKDGQDYIQIPVITSKNKKGIDKTRGVIAMPQLKPYLEYIKTQESLYNPNNYMFIHPKTTQLNKKYIGTPIKTFKTQFRSFMEWSGLLVEKNPPHRERCLYSLRHTYFEQRILNNQVPLMALAENCGTSIQVIQKWYAELQAEQFADSLAGLMMKNN